MEQTTFLFTTLFDKKEDFIIPLNDIRSIKKLTDTSFRLEAGNHAYTIFETLDTLKRKLPHTY